MKIWITSQFVAQHYWATAPEQVGFLRNPHRHIFHVKVTWSVNHLDRDLEFFIQKEKLNNFIRKNYENKLLKNMSCEMIGIEIKTALGALEVEVSEDGENGAIV